MKFTSGLLLSAALLGFVACSDGDKSTSDKATTNATTVAPANAPATMPAAVNPPHGQPNHRCDIEVGAPLNTPAAPNLPMPNLQPIQAQPVQQQPAASGTVAPGMNPPHGQPGHDCAVPVGAPLTK